MKVVTAAQMRAIELQASSIGLSVDVLMENAGKAIAEEVRNAFGGVGGKHILILVGPGNNGGDGLVAARHFDAWGAEVQLYLCGRKKSGDKNLALAEERKINTLACEADKGLAGLELLAASSDIILDAVFGTGKRHPLEGVLKQILERVSEIRSRRTDTILVAVDTPSGLDVDTGAVDAGCPAADLTITLGYPKPGLFAFPGAEKVGRLVVADIGIPPSLAESVQTELITREFVRRQLPQRPAGANKGTFGRALIVAGSSNYIGAAFLVCMGAARVGAGLVTLATPRSLLPALASKLTETTYLPLPELNGEVVPGASIAIIQEAMSTSNVMAVGCGLGRSRSAGELLRAILARLSEKLGLPLILDADALNLLAETREWWRSLRTNAILTPHPGEMGRLAGVSVEDIQRDRLKQALEAARNWQKTIVLKGAFTIVAAPDGRAMLCDIANAGLASAGTGDVLTGAIAGLVAQGLPLFEAAACGVYLHAQAGEKVKQQIGDVGMLASDLLPMLPLVIKEIKAT